MLWDSTSAVTGKILFAQTRSSTNLTHRHSLCPFLEDRNGAGIFCPSEHIMQHVTDYQACIASSQSECICKDHSHAQGTCMFGGREDKQAI